MGKKLPNTPRSRIKSDLHNLFLRSRERAAALRRDHYTCRRCGKKQSRAKGKEAYVEVHHINGILWSEIIQFIYDQLLVNPALLHTLCRECHRSEHNTD